MCDNLATHVQGFFLRNGQKLYTKLSGIAVLYSHSSVQMHPRLAENGFL